MKIQNIIIKLGIVWSLLFAAMSFYWATGGMIGVESLGGYIYEQAIEREPSFLLIVWVTGFVKLLGALVLALLSTNIRLSYKRVLSLLCLAAGIFMILYGLGNIVTISLAKFNVLDFELSSYATKWRLIFWEPFWVVGGILYFMVGRAWFRTSTRTGE